MIVGDVTCVVMTLALYVGFEILVLVPSFRGMVLCAPSLLLWSMRLWNPCLQLLGLFCWVLFLVPSCITD